MISNYFSSICPKILDIGIRNFSQPQRWESMRFILFDGTNLDNDSHTNDSDFCYANWGQCFTTNQCSCSSNTCMHCCFHVIRHFLTKPVQTIRCTQHFAKVSLIFSIQFTLFCCAFQPSRLRTVRCHGQKAFTTYV